MKAITTFVLLTALAFGQDARHVNDWRVLPEAKPHHFSRRTKIIIVLTSVATGLFVARFTRQPHCDMKTYDGRPYSGVNIPCPSEKP